MPRHFDFGQIHSLRGHEADVYCACFSADSRLVATGGRDQTVRVWEVESGRQILCLPHSENVWSVAFHPSLPLLLSGDWEGNVSIWSTVDGSQHARYRPHGTYIGCISIAPGGRYVLSGSGNGTLLWDIATGIPIVKVQHKEYGALISARFVGARYAVCTLEDIGSVHVVERDKVYDFEFYRVEVLDLAKGATLRQWERMRRYIRQSESLPPHPWEVLGLPALDVERVHLSAADVSGDGQFAALGHGGDGIYVWDVKHKMMVRRFSENPDAYILALKFLKGKNELLVCTSSSGAHKTSVWDVREDTRVFSETALLRPRAVSPTGRYYLEALPGKELSIWQIRTRHIPDS